MNKYNNGARLRQKPTPITKKTMKQKKQFTLDNFIYHLWKIIIITVLLINILNLY
jgi:hypothetical protein